MDLFGISSKRDLNASLSGGDEVGSDAANFLKEYFALWFVW